MIRAGFSGLFFALLLTCAATTARADLSLAVDVGWEGHFRAGRWTPLYITLADTTARPVTLEVYTPHGQGFGMHTRLALSVSPAPATYPVYVPLTQALGDIVVIVRDARTERRLAEWPDPNLRNELAISAHQSTAGVLIGTSGRAPTLRGLARLDTRSGTVQTVFVEPLKLPSNPAGYDAFNVLVLNQPDFNRLNREQHQAITDWVRGGGDLILWPSDDPLPPTSPLVSILPCEVGETVVVETAPKLLETLGLPARFASIRGRALIPRSGAERVPLFGDDSAAVGYCGRAGFGRILVLPIDPTFFVFRDEKASREFWKPLFDGMLDLRAPVGNEHVNYYWNDPMVRRRAEAFNHVSEMLGNVPGVGQFGFTYIAVALIALMVIVGPVDWFMLRYLGKQPWTWVTTTGWVALITTGALLVGQLFKSGELHFRTMRLIDQADGQVVATTDFVALYSPRTRLYEFSVPRESWWQPGADTMHGYGGTLRNDVPFAQDVVSNRPRPMIVNVWNLRFLQGETMTTAPPLIEASLRVENGAGGESHIVGTITNRSKHAMRNVRVRSAVNPVAANEVPEMRRIEPGQTIDVRAIAGATDGIASEALAVYAGDLAPDRAATVDQLLESRDDIVCIYAELEDPRPTVTINVADAKQQHWQVVRALVTLQTGEER